MAPNGGIAFGRHGPLSAMARLWSTSHAPDYFGLLALLVLWIPVVVLVTPFHRMFYVNDLHISFPHAAHERVTVFMNFVYALFGPLGVLIAWNVLARSSRNKHEVTYLPFLVSILFTTFVTDVVKNAVGRPRPDLLDRCKPDADTEPNTLVTIAVCTRPSSHALHDGWRSFPSGHASFSFAGLGFLSLFLAGQLHVFSTGSRDFGRALVCIGPLLGATMIAISRCEDYRHDVYDVTFGSLLGFAVAYWSYRRHWPELSDPNCHEPFARPGADTLLQPPRWQMVRDEEEGGADAVGLDVV